MPRKGEITPLSVRFWRHVRRDPSGCWLWMGSINPKSGYGQLIIRTPGQRNKHRIIKAHRLAWEVAHGPIPPGMDVLHECDVKPCVRNDEEPGHLYLGTDVENGADRKARGQAASGKRHGSHTHPERRARGARNGSVTHPESRPRGERNTKARLTAAQVQEIRTLRGRRSGPEVAQQFGVSRSAISHIWNGHSWGHLH